MHRDPNGTHPVLRRLSTALEERHLSWTLLRVPSRPAAPTGDVDILVAPDHSGALREAAEEVGFVAVPGYESPPSLMLVRYDRASDHWLILDVATAVSFRDPPSWQVRGMDREVRRRRQLRDGMAVPADEDAFWLLLLHCLLDKRAVAPEYRATLKELATRACGSPIARMVLSAAGDRWSPSVFTDAVLSARWQALEEMGARLAADLNRRRPIRDKARALAERALATARKPLLLARRRGVSVALLGPNGVGKSTAAEALQRAFPFESRVAYMGIWKEPGGGAVRARLEIVARPLRIWGRYLAAVYHQLRGCLVIFDRYVHEAWLPAKPPALALKKPYYWLLRHAIPPADLAVVLDVPGHVAYARKRENPPHELEWERRIYRELAGRLPSLEVVDASRDPDAVRADIMALVWLSVTRRWEGDRSRGKFAAAFGPSISSTTADRS